MAKRPKRIDTESGARFRHWLKFRYGSIAGAAEKFDMQPESLNPYFKGDLEIGGVWIDRIESDGGDYHYILTGRRPDSDTDSVYGGNKRFLGSANYPNVTPDDIRIELHEQASSTDVRVFKIEKPAKSLPIEEPVDYEDFGRVAAGEQREIANCIAAIKPLIKKNHIEKAYREIPELTEILHRILSA